VVIIEALTSAEADVKKIRDERQASGRRRKKTPMQEEAEWRKQEPNTRTDHRNDSGTASKSASRFANTDDTQSTTLCAPFTLQASKPSTTSP
jgi:hypothetical protein